MCHKGHLPLICNKDGSKISKRQNDIDVLSYRNAGYLPETLLVYLSNIGGGLNANIGEENSQEFFKTSQTVLSDLAKLFVETKINNRSVKLNQDLLDRLNRRFLNIRLNSSDSNEQQALVNELKNNLLENQENIKLNEYYLRDEYLLSVLKWSVERVYKIKDLTTDPGFSFLWSDLSNFKIGELNAQTQRQLNELIECLKQFLADKSLDENFFKDSTVFKKAMSNLFNNLTTNSESNSTESKSKKFNNWQLTRLLFTGSLTGPSIFEIFNLLDKNNLKYRLEIAKNLLDK